MANMNSQPGQGTAGSSNLQAPLATGRPNQRRPRPSELRSNPVHSPGQGTNGSSKTANSVGK